MLDGIGRNGSFIFTVNESCTNSSGEIETKRQLANDPVSLAIIFSYLVLNGLISNHRFKEYVRDVC